MSEKHPSPLGGLSRVARRLGKKRLILLGVCILLALAAIICVSVLGKGSADTGSAEATARAALDAYLSFDSEKTLSLFHEKYISFAADKYYGGSESGFKSLLKSNTAKNKSEFISRYGTWTYSDVHVKSSREYSSDELAALNEDLEALEVGLKLRSACKLKLGYTLSYVSEQDMRLTEERTYEAFVVKIGSRWYLFDE